MAAQNEVAYSIAFRVKPSQHTNSYQEVSTTLYVIFLRKKLNWLIPFMKNLTESISKKIYYTDFWYTYSRYDRKNVECYFLSL